MIELSHHKLSDLIAMIEETGQVGYWQFDVDTDRFEWSAQVHRIHGRPGEGRPVPRRDALDALHADDRPMVEESLRAAVKGREFQMDARVVRPDGSIRYVKIAGRPFANGEGRIGSVLGILIDITEFKRTENKLRRLAETDPLTGAVNVRRFESLVGAELRRMARFGKPATLAIIDIDGFKGINDTFGHPVGDDVLRAFVKTMMRTLREVDVVARIGGDEFAILMPETGIAEAAIPLERIAGLSRSLAVEREGLNICLTFSAGMATMTPGMDLHEILRSADKLLYQAKRDGVSRVAPIAGSRRKQLSS
ncbi:MAG: sensor domain-containing diguanylate cyclase [Candidimonas sp.]